MKNNHSKLTFILVTVFTSVAIILLSFQKSEDLKELSYIFYSYPPVPGHYVSKDSVELEKQIKNTERKIATSLRRLENLLPYGPYLIINTTQNKFVLRTRKGIIREGICSTGSYVLLDAGDGKQWMFKTPKGMFPILGKIVDPIWIKPDWAFVEESLPIPPRNHPDRLEYGTLGDYALTLGDGYLIHGTLYQRFLGLPVTHGCVRLGDDDLEVVFKNLHVGSRVYIF